MKNENSATAVQPDGKKRLAATGGVIGAILASSCCILPLVLVTLGVSGAWIGSLSALDPYKPWFAAVTAGFLGLDFWQAKKCPSEAVARARSLEAATAGRGSPAAPATTVRKGTGRVGEPVVVSRSCIRSKL